MNIRQQIYEQGYWLQKGQYNWKAKPLNPTLNHSIKAKKLEDILQVILALKGGVYV